MQKYYFAVSFGMSYTPAGQNIPKISGILLENFYFRMNIQYPAQNHRIFCLTLKLERTRNKV